MNIEVLEIVICTYNRPLELFDCLSSLSIQEAVTRPWSILVVNNHHERLDQSLLELLDSFPNARVVHESIAGLSIARNRAIEESNATWLGFLDDDAKVPVNFVQRAISIIDTEDFDCFGGHIRSWWKYGRPRWLEKNFGSKPKLRMDRGIISESYNWGSNIFINKEALVTVGGFPEDIGLKGQLLGYAAENLVQIKLRQNAMIIGYDPNLIVDHVVMPEKLKLAWHFKASYATGRDGRAVFPDQYGWRGMSKTMIRCLSVPIKSIWKWITESNYYWENVVLDTGKAWALSVGKLVAGARKK